MRSLDCYESDLMLLAAREEPSNEVLARITALIPRCHNLAYFAKVCVAHKVHPLVLHSFSRLTESDGPDFLLGLRRILQSQFRRRWLKRRVLVQQVVQITRHTLAAGGYPFCFVRGTPFAERYYINPVLRVCNDVDVLVPGADYLKILRLLLSSGFVLNDSEALQAARIECQGQAELWHPSSHVLLDLNWLFTGNLGIGRVLGDVSKAWERVRHVRGYEYELSPEDAILQIIRHVGHGHDFEHGFLQSCVDITAILRLEGVGLNWNYVCEEARKCECLRILRLYSHFYDQYYRDESMYALGAQMPALTRVASDRECEWFARLIQGPLIRRKVRGKTTTQFVNGNICFAGKLWALDRMSRLAKCLLMLPWPPKHLLTFLTLESPTGSRVVRRLRYYINPLLPGLPGVIIGTTLRVFFEISKWSGKLWHRVRSTIAR